MKERAMAFGRKKVETKAERAIREASLEDSDANRDPITGAPGAHPVGSGIGAVSGGAAGAAIGSIGGPVGTVAGAVIGGVAGGLAGKGIAESVHPTAQDEYRRDNYRGRD
jgi:outer membrane lipoprotein SlyB